MEASLRTKALLRALQICGSSRQLAARLHVAEHSLELWRQGKATLPDRVFHVLVDLILEDDIARAAQDRRAVPRGATASGF